MERVARLRRSRMPLPAMALVLACCCSGALAQPLLTGGDAADPPLPRVSLTVLPPLVPGSNPQVGLQWSQPLGAQRSIDVTAWRRVEPQQPDALSLIQQREPTYGARVEMRLAPAKRGLATDLKAIGLQLDNGAKIMLRRKDGNPALYYRQQF